MKLIKEMQHGCRAINRKNFNYEIDLRILSVEATKEQVL